MVGALDCFRSVEHVWLVWFIGIGVLGTITALALSRLSWPDMASFWSDEEGAAYSIAYVMTLPFYILFVCLVIEATLMLAAKLGTVYAAYAGARTAIVWYSAAQPDDAARRVEAAARRAMVPFANGTAPNGHKPGALPSVAQTVYTKAYRNSSRKPASSRYVSAKYAYAHRLLLPGLAIKTNIPKGKKPATWDTDIAVTVTYRFRYQIPGIGRVLGKRDLDGEYVTLISTTVALQNEAPQNKQQSLGIGYGSPR